ncbi:MAG: ferredoxin family protein [Bacteroidales bacterium]|nr:ferredoxin family protein [Bacteroidales bacterium]
MKTKTKEMAAALAATIASGFVLHFRGGNGLTALHLISMGTFTVMATLHALSHSSSRRKRFGQPQATKHIQLDPRKCHACWKCVETCPKQVLGKIDLPFHKHTNIVNPDACIGCKKCVKACQHGAITVLLTNI